MSPMENREKFGELANELRNDIDNGIIIGDRITLAETIIDRLQNMDYDDFANETFATPKLQMIADFTALGMLNVVARIKHGDFDQ